MHDKTAGRLTAPKETGLYEIRYVLREGNKTIGSIFLEVIAADASLDDGAELSVPAAAQAGELISVSWSSTNNDHDQRIALARSNQADFSWVTVQATEEEKSMQLTMPDEPGSYEMRFLDLTARKVLGRSMIEVQ